MELAHLDHHDNGFSEVTSSKKHGIRVYIKKEGVSFFSTNSNKTQQILFKKFWRENFKFLI